jgi:CRISPR/Cas system CSM-associated protein Csm3 (group 7 of RAMP superfamily)
MARLQTHRLKIKGTLEAYGPLHIGGMRDSVETDMPLARDGQGRTYVPGTSLAGSMRAWVEARFGEDIAKQLWGFQPREDEADQGEEGYASYVVVEDAHVKPPQRLDEEIWDGVGIDREWSTAAEGIKFDRAILPKGTTFDLEVSVEIPPAWRSANGAAPNTMRAVVGHLLGALHRGEIGFGAARTRGLGSVKLLPNSLTVHEEDWSSTTGVLALLGGNTKTLTPEELMQASPRTTPSSPSCIHIEIGWEPDGPVMVTASQDGIAVDILPMVSGYGSQKVTMVLPGSSLKGALRGQAERIVRTVLDSDPAVYWNTLRERQRHLRQVEVPLVEHLFGSAKKPEPGGQREDEAKDDAADAGGSGTSSRFIAGRGVLEVDTCYATAATLSPQHWEAIVTAKSAEKVRPGEASSLYQAIGAAGCMADSKQLHKAYFQQAFHVAVDRWTGGAAEGFLYSTLEPFGMQWEPIVLTLDLDTPRLPAALHKPATALLLLLLRDLAMNRIPIGFAGNRGHGSIKIKTVHIQPENVGWLGSGTLPQGELRAIHAEQLRGLEYAWNQWIEQTRMSGVTL